MLRIPILHVVSFPYSFFFLVVALCFLVEKRTGTATLCSTLLRPWLVLGERIFGVASAEILCARFLGALNRGA